MLLAALALTLAVQDTGPPPEFAELAPPELRAEDLERWRAHFAPAEDELAYDAIDWVASFPAGIERASREARPLLFWAMNGHPLGCT